MAKLQKYFLKHLAAAVVVCVMPALASSLHFSAQQLLDWQVKSFHGETQYALTNDGDQAVLSADSEASASGLVMETRVDLSATPYLNWSWNVRQLPATRADESEKDGDDYAARVYMIFKTGPLFWQSAALNYVWANRRAVGDHWPNAFTNKVTMLAVDSGAEKTGQWHSYKRNVADDIKRYLGKEVNELKVIAIMTDSDDSASRARAYYGDIYFSAE